MRDFILTMGIVIGIVLMFVLATILNVNLIKPITVIDINVIAVILAPFTTILVSLLVCKK